MRKENSILFTYSFQGFLHSQIHPFQHLLGILRPPVHSLQRFPNALSILSINSFARVSSALIVLSVLSWSSLIKLSVLWVKTNAKKIARAPSIILPMPIIQVNVSIPYFNQNLLGVKRQSILQENIHQGDSIPLKTPIFAHPPYP